jgi:uncharacterized membrane protein YidH (DUF202 family)
MKDVWIVALALGGIGTVLGVAACWERTTRPLELDKQGQSIDVMAIVVLVVVAAIVIAAIGFMAVYGNA